MNNSLKLSDFQAPLVIDIGSDTVKFSQANLNTYNISQNMRNANKKENLDDTTTPNTDRATKNSFYNINNEHSSTPFNFSEINSNTIFDYNLFMDSFPTLLALASNEQNNDEENFEKIRKSFNIKDANDLKRVFQMKEFKEFLDKKIDYSFDYFKNEIESKNFEFGYEPVWNGKVNLDHIEKWKSLIEKVGECKFQKHRFLSQLYSETPLILTQNSLDFETLKSQVSKICEIAFEEYKCPYLLICSQAMLNLYSHNMTSGIAVDIGESGTNISTIKNGFTKYDSTTNVDFLSGRNISNLLCLDLKNSSPNSSSYEVTMREYLEAKFIKENNLEKRRVQNLNYIFSFPEVFKCVLNTNNVLTQTDFYSNMRTVENFINERSLDSKKFNEREKFDNYLFTDFEKHIITPYMNQTFDSLEKRTIKKDCNFLNKEELQKFRHFSLSHNILIHLQNLIEEDNLNANKYINIAFSGGVLNTPGLQNLIEDDLNSMFKKQRNENLKLYFSKNVNNSEAFYKGANYLSKLDNLETLMISRQDYYDYGSDYVCYNYI